MRIEVTQEDIVKGIPRNGESCPIARAASRQTKFRVYVSGKMAEFYDPSTGHSTWFFLPRPARSFVRSFDEEDKVEPLTFDVKWRAPFRR